MIAVSNMLIVGEPTNGPYIAQRFKDDFQDNINSFREIDMDSPVASKVQEMVEFSLSNGLDLRAFQTRVIETFNTFASAMFDDDLVEDLIHEREHPDLHDVMEIVFEFNRENPGYIVQSLVPVDLKGTFGFIIKANQNGHS